MFHCVWVESLQPSLSDFGQSRMSLNRSSTGSKASPECVSQIKVFHKNSIYLAVNRAGEIVATLCAIKNWARCTIVSRLGDNVPSPSTLTRITPVARFGARAPFTPAADLDICFQCLVFNNGFGYRAVDRAVEVIAGPRCKKNWARNPTMLSFSLDTPSSLALTKATWLRARAPLVPSTHLGVFLQFLSFVMNFFLINSPHSQSGRGSHCSFWFHQELDKMPHRMWVW